MLLLFDNLDVKTLMTVLCLGNIVSAILIAAYRATAFMNGAERVSRYLLIAKAFQAAAYYLFLSRNDLSDFTSVGVANILLFIGFYFEALAMMAILSGQRTRIHTLLLGILLVCIFSFTMAEIFFPSSSLRIIVASACVFAILLLPNIMTLHYRSQGGFHRWAVVFYTLFLILLLPRAIYAMFNEVTIFSNFFIQQLTFLSMTLLLIYSIPSYLLVIKEKNDKVIKDIATTDYLTKLPNRFRFMEEAETLLSRGKKQQTSIALLFIDIDYFKYTNDKYGHNFGDWVLVDLARVLRENLRDGDVLCRYGGEEFAVLIQNADLPVVQKIAHRIMDGVAESRFEGIPLFRYTISMGIAYGIPDKHILLSELIETADETLDIAKNNGRNRIEFLNLNETEKRRRESSTTAPKPLPAKEQFKSVHSEVKTP